MKSIYKRILAYLLVSSFELLIFFVIGLLIVSGNVFLVIGGIVCAICNTVLCGSLIIREVLYWVTRKKNC